ncbi:MFS transporter, partial [Enterobacter chengduensis]|uniref:MFS transporter n=1 Tax=Enterobacter chengduensis TaxID=2494701 RepID=UPI000ADD4845
MNSSTNAVKRWWYIMPIVFITYSLAYLDRANFSFASAAGITEDLGITKGVSSLLGALFFLGYFFFQIPGAIYAERRSVRKLIFVCLILWGACASLTGVVNNIPALAAIRFILGVVEAAVMPAMLIYISNWFTKSERSRANTFLILGNPVTVLWMSVVSGYLIQSFGWREMFIIEGVPAVIWAFCWWVLVKDKPAQAKWLSEDEKAALQAQHKAVHANAPGKILRAEQEHITRAEGFPVVTYRLQTLLFFVQLCLQRRFFVFGKPFRLGRLIFHQHP